MRVVFMGTPDFAVMPLETLLRNGHRVAAVYTQPDRAAGRGRALEFPPVKRAAREWHLPVLQPPTLKDDKVVAQLAAFEPEVIVAAAYGRLLPPPVLELPACGCVDIHPSLLPRYRGASPVAAALLHGDDFTGVSMMLMTGEMDAGPVLCQAPVAVLPYDNAGSLTGKLSRVASHLLIDMLVRWPVGELRPRPQDEAAATYCGKVAKEDGELDWSLSAVELWRRVRAFTPWPGGYTTWRGVTLKIIEAVPLAAASPGAGRVVAVAGRPGIFGIGTGQGVLGVLKVQRAGGRALTADSFLRGHRDFMGSVLPG